MKGALLSAAPGLTLVDVTHAVPPGDVRAGAYLLGRAWPRFPTGTVHLAVVDPGVGTGRAGLAVAAHGHYFVGPDNGLFTLVLRDAEVQIVVLPTPDGASPTFHGRDVFAPAAAALAAGATLAEAGPALRRDARPAGLPGAAPRGQERDGPGGVRGPLRHAGHQPHTRAGAALCRDRGRRARGGTASPHLRRRAHRRSGGLLGSGGQVEIAVRDGSAARRLGMGVGGRIRARLG